MLHQPARQKMSHRISLLSQHLTPPAPAAAAAAVVLHDPPEGWPDWLPFPTHTHVPRFPLGSPEAKSFLEKEGYVVIRDVLDENEVKTALDLLWKEIEARSDGVVRSDPKTWDKGWQTNGWGHDDFLWYVRGCPNVRKVWEHLHDTDDLICSYLLFAISPCFCVENDWVYLRLQRALG